MRVLSVVLLVLFLFTLSSCSSVSDGKESEKIEPVMFKLEPFVLNAGSEGFVKVSMQIELAGPVIAERAKTKTPVLRDRIIMIATSKSPEELASPEGKLQLKDEISSSINLVLGDKSVKDIYFTDFIMQ